MNKPDSGTKKPQKSRFEFSAGGVVQDGPNLLMVQVKNLEGDVRWTFPKGHIEKGEKAPEAALREVEEETGYRCEIVKPFERVQYYFRRDDQVTKKTVTWFLMKPLAKTGTHDPEEILETEWVSMEEARKRVLYKSDKKLLDKLK
jgi:8-oxo-dGTP pyrophosphatase MutT (NUDIX family)